ncbi:MAG TPA: VCBS repeat-containing protein [Silvibacterium sp.]|nr:VCBS repeat-containing protein [Silvibacterium sp.]
MRKLSLLCIGLVVAAIVAPVALQAQNPTFSAPKPILIPVPNGYLPDIYLQGNFNGDGKTDLIAAIIPEHSTGNTTNEFLAGDGKGDFSVTGPVTSIASGVAAIYLVADVNGDGKDDIITLVGGCVPSNCSGGSYGYNSATISVLLSQGNGVFTPGYNGTLPDTLSGIEGVVDDFNKDGKPDIAVLAFSNNLDNNSEPSELCIFINQGNGTFKRTDYQVPATLHSYYDPALTNLVTGDFEGNGNQDIAFAIDTPANGQIMTFAGNGKGDFGPGVVSYTTDTGAAELFSADLNHDGRTDLLAYLGAKAGRGERVASLLANTSGRFYWGSAVHVEGPAGFVTFLSDDFNGDGNPDLFYYFVDSAENPDVGLYLGESNGSFQTPHIPVKLHIFPEVSVIRLQTGDLPSLLVQWANGEADTGIDLLINTTKK